MRLQGRAGLAITGEAGEMNEEAETKDTLPTLLPCPFCGADDAAVVDSDDHITYYVWCMACDASGPREGRRLDAVESWNRRVR